MEEIIIGNQIWMQHNLNVETFHNGDPIPEMKTDDEWAKAGSEKTPAWCYYGNNPDNGNVYGKLYNWYAVTDPRGIAPNGWHVPTSKEWSELSKYLGGEDTMGDKMKSTDVQYWVNPENKATDKSGFSGLPGGYRYYLGMFANIGSNGNWWFASELDNFSAYFMYLISNDGKAHFHHNYKKNGYSLRCIKD